MTTGSIQTDSDASHAGQSKETASQVFTKLLALMPVSFTFWKAALQCGHKLMDSPSLVGCGVEIASYREGASAHSAGHRSALASREGQHHTHLPGRSLPALMLLQRPHAGLPPIRPDQGVPTPRGFLEIQMDDVSVGLPL